MIFLLLILLKIDIASAEELDMEGEFMLPHSSICLKRLLCFLFCIEILYFVSHRLESSVSRYQHTF